MDDLHKPFAHRPRKQSLSAIIEKIVLEKQRQKEKAIFDQQLAIQRNADAKIEPCELIDDSANDSRSAPSQGDLPTSSFSQDGDSSVEMSQYGSKAPQSLIGQEDDEEVDEDDSTEKEDANIDPERLKAFNLFVRLFVDEQLDRTVPISKQPKDRIQTIIDSCNRQFPEFEDRARKRLRTYLKACRRHKKLREPLTVNDVARPGRMQAGHLTSVQAEMILAQACQNETRSAKRRHLESDGDANQDGPGLMQLRSMIPPESPAIESTPSASFAPPPEPAPVPAPVQSLPPYLPPTPVPAPVPAAERSFPAAERSFPVNERSFPATEPVMPAMPGPQPPTSAIYHADIGNLLRHVLPSRAGGPPPPSPSHGPGGELFFRRSSHAPLSFSEAVAVRALADGYRRSASLLRRTADELESLIPHGGL